MRHNPFPDKHYSQGSGKTVPARHFVQTHCPVFCHTCPRTSYQRYLFLCQDGVLSRNGAKRAVQSMSTAGNSSFKTSQFTSNSMQFDAIRTTTYTALGQVHSVYHWFTLSLRQFGDLPSSFYKIKKGTEHCAPSRNLGSGAGSIQAS